MVQEEGVSNLLFALPSLLVNAWPNADAALEIVDAYVPPGRSGPLMPGAGVGVRVGTMREDEPGIRWMKWAEVAESEAVSDR